MATLFHAIFYVPILNLLVWLYNIVPGENFIIAIVILTVVIKLILWPLSSKSIKAQKNLQALQPEIEKIKKDYKGKKEEMGKVLMELYKKNKVSPFSSCLPLLIQLPFLWAVFRVFRDGVQNNLDQVYSFISRPETINLVYLGADLSERSILFSVLAGLAQFVQAKMLMTKKPAIKSEGSKDENMAAIMSKQMTYFMPVITVFIGLSLPGGLTLYWFLTTALTALQQFYLFNKKNKVEVINQD